MAAIELGILLVGRIEDLQPHQMQLPLFLKALLLTDNSDFKSFLYTVVL